MYKYVLCIVMMFSITCQQSLAADSRTNRGDSSFGIDIGLAPVSFPLPGTKVASLYYIASPGWQIGLEYAWTTLGLSALSFEIGEVEETNKTIKARYFPSNSFNWIMGYGQRDVKVKLPGDLFDLVTHDYNNIITHTKTNYAQVGMGNQWQWKSGYAFSVDWLTINIPVKAEVVSSADQYANSESDAEHIRRAEKILSWYPQTWIFEIKVGFAF